MPYGEVSAPPPPPPRKWRVVMPDGAGALEFTGWFHVDQAGALWCDSVERGQTVFGPGMWVRIFSVEEDD